MSTSFWETFLLFLIFLPLALIWGFALWDIFRRDDLSASGRFCGRSSSSCCRSWGPSST
jgi:hypothetical protein